MVRFIDEIKQQPSVLQKVADFYCSEEGHALFEKVERLCRSRKCSHIIFTGMGSSCFLSGAAFVKMTGLDKSISWEDSGELLHYGQGHFLPGTVVFMISQSGESFEVKALLEKIKTERVPVAGIVGITNDTESTLASLSDVVLPIFAGPEQMTSSKTFVATYLVILLLSRYLRQMDLSLDGWEDMMAQMNGMLVETDKFGSYAAMFKNTHFVQCIARGPLTVVSNQTALMCMEVDKIPASSLSGGAFRHGPIESVSEDFKVVIFAHSADGTFAQSCALVQDILAHGGEVLMVSDRRPACGHNHFHHITIPCRNPELFPMLSVIPMQLIANQIAAENPVPGSFTIGHKITSME